MATAEPIHRAASDDEHNLYIGVDRRQFMGKTLDEDLSNLKNVLELSTLPENFRLPSPRVAFQEHRARCGLCCTYPRLAKRKDQRARAVVHGNSAAADAVDFLYTPGGPCLCS